MTTNDVHETAVVPTGVVLGARNVVGPYVVLLPPLVVGDDNWFGPGTTVGAPAEIRDTHHGSAWAGEAVGTGVRIGCRNVFREHVSIHQGHYDITVVGDDCYVMNRAYVGHDGHVGDGVTLAAGVSCGGHVHLGAGANLGMNAVVHQHRVVGNGAMVGMGSVVTRDVPPYAKAYGNPCRVVSANVVGLGRAGVPDDEAEGVRAAYESGASALPDTVAHPGLVAARAWWRSQVGRR